MSAVDSPALADAAERSAALDADRSFIVQAPAGSGKTELLTQRLLVLLARVDEPEEVIAMTFTRKAAAEMRQRVFAAVRGALDDTPPADAHRRRTWSLARAALQRSRARGWRLEDNPQRLRVLTIDALCAQIVQLSPLTSGVGGRVRISERPEPMYREAVRATLAAIEADSAHAAPVARVLRHFDNRTDLLERQLIALLARREQWLRLSTHEGRAQQPRAALEATLDWLVRDALCLVDDLIPAALRGPWLASAAHASTQLSVGSPDAALHELRDGVWPAPEPALLGRWRALADLVLTQDARSRSWRSKVDATLGFPAGRTGAERAALAPPREAHQRLIAQLREVSGLLEALAALYALPAPRYEDRQWAVLDALLDTLRLAAAHLRIVFAAHGEVDFAEIAAQAIAALGDAGAPSDLALRLDYRVQHLLVDEFQDTSSVQWTLLQRLTEGWVPGDGRTLFVVGDPMQSIYRFREADVGLFLRAWRDGIGDLRLQPLRLRCNFRSRAGIVDWVNAAFARVLPAAADLNRSAVPYSAAVATRPADPAPAVCVHAAAGEDGEAEAHRVLELVLEAGREPGERTAILVRSRGHLTQIAQVLRDAGLRYRAVDIESLAERPVILDLRALTWALLHPQDRSAWLAVLRAPWCGLTLADLHALAGDLPQHESLWSALHDEARQHAVSEDGRRRLAPVVRTLERALAEQGRRPLRRWTEATWLALGGPACAGTPAALADAAAYFDCLQQLAAGPSLDDFSRLDLALSTLRAAPDPDADESLSLMTIHKSKGLEFDTVIVPGLGRGTRNDDQPPIVWARLTDVDGAEQLLLAPVHAAGDERDPIFDFVRGLEADKQRFEDARLLYVAATRARRRLHLLGSLPASGSGGSRKPPARSLLARLWPAVAADFAGGEAERGAAAGPALASERVPPALRRLIGWSELAPAPGLPLPAPLVGERGGMLRFDWAGERARCVGVVFHRWVQRIAGDGVEAWDVARCDTLAAAVDDDLRSEGVPATQLAPARERVLQALRTTLGDPRGRWLLAGGHVDAFSELGLSVVQGARVRRVIVDRTFVDADGTRWVVDFKTSTHEGGDVAGFVAQELARYRGQLESYVDAIGRLFGGVVRAALYLPLIDDPSLRWAELER